MTAATAAREKVVDDFVHVHHACPRPRPEESVGGVRDYRAALLWNNSTKARK